MITFSNCLCVRTPAGGMCVMRSYDQRPVFYDPTGRRGWLVNGLSWALFTVLGILTACMVLTVGAAPGVDRLKFTSSHRPLAAGQVSPRSNTGEPTLKTDYSRRSSHATANSAT